MIKIAVLFIIMGILIKYGKFYFLIAGYNTLPAKEKARYDIEGIATVFRNTFFGMALIILVGYFAGNLLNNPDIKSFAFYGSMIVGIPYLLLKANSSKYKCDKKGD